MFKRHCRDCAHACSFAHFLLFFRSARLITDETLSSLASNYMLRTKTTQATEQVLWSPIRNQVYNRELRGLPVLFGRLNPSTKVVEST